MSILPRCACNDSGFFLEHSESCPRHYATARWVREKREQRDAELRCLRQQAVTRPVHGGYPETRPAPIDMVLHCPKCGTQHVDMVEYVEIDRGPNSMPGNRRVWDNPPHRSHLCHSCGCVWRPADVPTNGVEKIETRGKHDNWPEL